MERTLLPSSHLHNYACMHASCTHLQALGLRRAPMLGHHLSYHAAICAALVRAEGHVGAFSSPLGAGAAVALMTGVRRRLNPWSVCFADKNKVVSV